MVIHNTETLVERAEWHAKQDHIYQGTYGCGKVNGKAEFVGCAIGCLATPHKPRELVEFLRANLGDADASSALWGPGKKFLAIDSFDQTQEIAEQFGICRGLMRLVEDVFEGLSTHGAAINFVRDFARVCAEIEGADIKDEDATYTIQPKLRELEYDDQPPALFDAMREVAHAQVTA